MKKHIHKWKATGVVLYSCPAQRQEKCTICEETRNVEIPGTGIKVISGEAARKRIAEYEQRWEQERKRIANAVQPDSDGPLPKSPKHGGSGES